MSPLRPIAGALALLVGWLIAAGPARAATLPTLPAAAVLDAVGVNTHFGYQDLPGWSHPDRAAAALDYLRGRAPTIVIRDSIPQFTGALYTSLCRAHGARFDMLVDSGGGLDVRNDVPRYLVPWAGANRGCIAFLEGPNELDMKHAPIIDGIVGSADPVRAAAAALAYIRGFRDTTPALAGIPIINASLTVGVNPRQQSILDAMGAQRAASDADIVNQHIYPNLREQDVLTAVLSALRYGRMIDPRKPIAITEYGFISNNTGGALGTPGVQSAPDGWIADAAPDYVLDAVSRGVVLVDYYELMNDHCDPPPDDLESNYGLFACDGTPKPQATALRNLRDAVAEGAGGAAAQGRLPPLDATLSGGGRGTQALAVAFAPGEYGVFVWDEQRSGAATLTLAGHAASAVVTDIPGGATGPAQRNVRAIRVPTGPAPQFVRLHGVTP